MVEQLLGLYKSLMETGILSALSFLFLAVVVIGSALAVVFIKNLVHSVLWLVVTLIGIAGIYAMLSAEFLAVVQILVYAGAVCIMVVFGVMLTRRGGTGRSSNPFNRQALGAGIVGLLALLVTVLLTAGTSWKVTKAEVPADTVGNIAEILLSKYVIPFEVAAILLLVALFGAIVLAREVKSNDKSGGS